jgi:TPR repeat protein
MANPIAFVLLDAPTKLNAAAILETLNARYPNQPCVMPPGDPDGAAAIFLTLANTVVAIMQIEAPLPEGWQPAASRAAIYWPEAEAVFKRHRAHFVVSVMGDAKYHLQVERVTTAVAGALVATHPLCTAMLWASTVGNSSPIVADLSRLAFADYPDFPAGLWVSLNPFRDPGSPNVGVITMGLNRFVGRELELDAPASQFKRLLIMTQRLVAYLIQYGANVHDGDTFGESATERISLHFRDSLRFNGLPVIAAELPAIAPGGAEREAPKTAVTVPANEMPAPPPAPSIVDQRQSVDLATPPAGVESSAAKTSFDVPMPLPPGWKVPRLLSPQFLIEIDEAAFRSSTPDDQQRLKKAVGDYRALRFDEMIDDLTDASSSDANVLFLRALGVLRQSGSNKFTAAHGLLQAAVSGGQRQAAIVLGILLVAGPEGVDKDLGQGKNLIETAAEAGDRMAQRAAGIGDIGGEFGSLDPVKGVAWIRRAAEAGDAPAMLHYGFLLSIGSGVEKNTALAEDYVRRAAVAGLTAAQETLGAWIVERYKSGLAADPSEGVRWLKQAYELGFSTHALVRLGLFYSDDGRGAWRDRNRSFALFSLCIGYASSSCQFAYAWHLANGFGTPINPVESYARYEVARQLGATKAPERMQALQRVLSPGEVPKAIELASSIRSALRPVPTTVVFQYPGVRPQPSPWPVTASSAPAAASSRRHLH